MFFVIVLITYYPLISFSNPDIAKQIHSINQSKSKTPKDNIGCLYCFDDLNTVKKNEEELFQQCAMSLCGPAHKSPSYKRNFINRFYQTETKKVDALFNVIKKDIKGVIRNKEKHTGDLVLALKKYMPNNKFNLALLGSNSEYLQDLLTTLLYYYVDVTIDYTKNVNERIQVAWPPETPEQLKSILVPFEKTLKNSWMTDIPYTNLELVNILKKQSKRSKYLKNQNMKDLRFFSRHRLLTLYSGAISSNRKDFNDVLHLFPNKVDPLFSAKEKIFFCNTTCKSILSNFLDKKIKKIKLSLKNNLFAEHLASAEAECKASISSHLNYKNEKKIDKKSLAKSVFSVRKGVLKYLKGYSKETYKKIKPFLKKRVTVSLPSNKGALSLGPKNIKELMPIDFNLPASVNMDNLLMLQHVLGWEVSDWGGGCVDSDHPADQYSSDYRSIDLSFFSCKHFPDAGAGALAHEFGHAVENLFLHQDISTKSSKQFRANRKCSTSLVSTDSAVEEMVKGDFYTTGEDFADMVSSSLSVFAKKIFACAYLGRDENNLKYIDLGMRHSEASKWNLHSPPFVRLLKEAIQRKAKLSGSCKLIVNQYKNTYNLKQCLL